MNPSSRPFRARIIGLICAVLFLSAASGLANSKEQRAFDSAQEAMRDGFWDRAEAEFGDFAGKFPKSELRAQAVLFQGQARYKMTNSTGAVQVLQANLPQAGFLADEYYFWIAEAHFQAANYAAAAESYARLEHDFPVSDHLLEACLGEAASRAQLGQWPQIVALLSEPYGIFGQAAKKVPPDPSVPRGWLLLSDAYLNQGDATHAQAALTQLGDTPLGGTLNWQRTLLQCRILLAQHHEDEALQTSTNLESIAQGLGPQSAELLAEGALFQSRILERLGRLDDAIAALQPNLAKDIPPSAQRQSLLKIAQLSLAEGKSADARQTLEKFLSDYPGAPAMDTALVALGELELRDAIAAMAATSPGGLFERTNPIPQVVARFDEVLTNYPGSPATAQAKLDKGWSLWLAGDTSQSLPLFRQASQELPPGSQEQTIARFKWADTQLETGDYAGALANYQRVIKDSESLPGTPGQWQELAFYQTVRSGLRAGNMGAATDAMREIFQLYPNGLLGAHSLLLVGQGMMQRQDPAGARALFEEFARRNPGALAPEINLAIARTHELEGDWKTAIDNYNHWLAANSNSTDRAQAQYYRAWATFEGGDETNALIQFTNFVAQFPTNGLAPMAQWWVADHYYRQGDFLSAEKNYKSLFQTWPESELSMEAHLMAGRAAVGWQNFAGAIEYFTNLTSRVDCPPKLKTQALFAYGDALVQSSGTDTNRFANLDLARQVYSQICQINPTNEDGLLAWGQIGNCYLQMGAQNPNYYTNAEDAYVRVTTSPYAGIAARSQAYIGVGHVLEYEAQTKPEPERTEWLKDGALKQYQDVVYGVIVHEGETNDLYWTKQAGVEAARLAESLGEWNQAIEMYRRLERMMPELKDSLDKKIARAKEQFVHGAD